jgi:hypothetical protein
VPRCVIVFVLFGFASIRLFGQAAPAEQAKKECSISGQILNATTDQPLRKATVTLHSAEGRQGPRETDVDAAGRFEFRGLEPGRYMVSASRTGYANQAYGAKRPGYRTGTMLSLLAGEEMKGIVIKLSPHGVIMGHVFDEEGEPIANANVTATGYQWVGKRRQPTSGGGASTNDLGEYRIFGVAPGTYYIQVTKSRGFTMAAPDLVVSPKPELDYVTTYFPGVPDLTGAAQVQVRSGMELRGMDLRMVKARTVRVRGTVINGATGRPASAYLMLLPRNRGVAAWNEMRSANVMDPKAGFEFKSVPAGSYTLQASVFSQDARLMATQTVEVGDENILNLVVTLGTGGEIEGTLTVEGTPPQRSDDRPPRVTLGAWDADADGGMYAATGEVKEDGTFRIKGVPQARLRVFAYGLEGAYLKSAMWGDQDLLENGLDLTQGITGGTLRLVMSMNGAEVAGSVQRSDGKAASGAMVVLIPEEQYRQDINRFQTANTDQGGGFRMRGLRPGKYKLAAWEELEGAEFMDPEFLKLFEKKLITVNLEEGSHESVQVTAVSAEQTAEAQQKRGQ